MTSPRLRLREDAVARRLLVFSHHRHNISDYPRNKPLPKLYVVHLYCTDNLRAARIFARHLMHILYFPKGLGIFDAGSPVAIEHIPCPDYLIVRGALMELHRAPAE